MIEITCPGCSTELEIDEGFRGGVCRCHSCGALLSVPDEDETPPGVPDRPDAPTPKDTPPPATDTDEILDLGDDEEDESPSQAPPTPSPRRTQSTASRSRGSDSTQRTRRTSSHKAKPKASMYALFGVAVIILLGVIGILIKGIIDKSASTEEEEILPVEISDIQKNPYTAKTPNMLQALVTSDTVIVVDASTSMKDHIWQVNAACEALINQTGNKHKLAFVYTSETATNTHPDTLTPGSSITDTSLNKFTQEQAETGSGGQKIQEALTKAASLNPRKIILVLRTFPANDNWEATQKKLKDDNIKLSAVLIKGISNELNDICKDTGGKLHEISSGQLSRWHQKYVAQKDNPLPEPTDNDNPDTDSDTDTDADADADNPDEN